MLEVPKSTLFGVIGAVISCLIMFIGAFMYSYDVPATTTLVVALVGGSLVGFVAGAAWGKRALKWLVEILMNV